MVDVSKGVAFGQRLLFCRSEREGENMAEPGALDYFYGAEAERYTFYRISKMLFTAPGFRRIIADAKILFKWYGRIRHAPYEQTRKIKENRDFTIFWFHREPPVCFGHQTGLS